MCICILEILCILALLCITLIFPTRWHGKNFLQAWSFHRKQQFALSRVVPVWDEPDRTSSWGRVWLSLYPAAGRARHPLHGLLTDPSPWLHMSTAQTPGSRYQSTATLLLHPVNHFYISCSWKILSLQYSFTMRLLLGHRNFPIKSWHNWRWTYEIS